MFSKLNANQIQPIAQCKCVLTLGLLILPACQYDSNDVCDPHPFQERLNSKAMSLHLLLPLVSQLVLPGKIQRSRLTLESVMYLGAAKPSIASVIKSWKSFARKICVSLNVRVCSCTHLYHDRYLSIFPFLFLHASSSTAVTSLQDHHWPQELPHLQEAQTLQLQQADLQELLPFQLFQLHPWCSLRSLCVIVWC